MSVQRFIVVTLLVAGVAVVAVLLLALRLSAAAERQRDETCAALGAHAVYTGRGHFLCVDGNGRVVGP